MDNNIYDRTETRIVGKLRGVVVKLGLVEFPGGRKKGLSGRRDCREATLLYGKKDRREAAQRGREAGALGATKYTPEITNSEIP